MNEPSFSNAEQQHVQNLDAKFQSVAAEDGVGVGVDVDAAPSSSLDPPPLGSTTTIRDSVLPVQENHNEHHDENEDEDLPLDALVPLNDSVDDDDDDDDDDEQHCKNSNNIIKTASNHSVDLSVDSLDQVDREYLGEARRHHHHQQHKQQQPYQASVTTTCSSSTATNHNRMSSSPILRPWCELRVADSVFLGFVTTIAVQHSSSSSSSSSPRDVNSDNGVGVLDFVSRLKQQHPDAAHIPYAWNCDMTQPQKQPRDNNDNNSWGYDDDGEPEAAHTGLTLWNTINPQNDHNSNGDDTNTNKNTAQYLLFPKQEEPAAAVAADNTTFLQPNKSGGGGGGIVVVVVAVVRYFHGQWLLGVTCGRLTQCYQRVAQCAVHRYRRGWRVPQYLDLSTTATTTTTTTTTDALVNSNTKNGTNNWYGLAAGDTELHVNILQNNYNKLQQLPTSRDEWLTGLLDELDFGGFRGAKGEVLPRLQNLQADFYTYDSSSSSSSSSFGGNNTTNGTTGLFLRKDNDHGTIVPVYRYPGNYLGDEWETFRWSPLSHHIKETVEAALPHFYKDQQQQQQHQTTTTATTINHCVTNYYRHGDDYIAHHSDKDLDLNQQDNCAIVSVSIGAERILELRRREEPRDVTRLKLPHGSMLLLGPITNRQFTHSIIPALEPDTDGDSTAAGRQNHATTRGQRSTTTVNGGGGGKYDKNARISLTLRHVTTFMDTSTQRLFGQGISCKSLQDLRRSQRLETIYFGLGFGSLWNAIRKSFSTLPTHPWSRILFPWSSSFNPSSTSSSSSTSSVSIINDSLLRPFSPWWQNLAQEGLVLLSSAGLAWWTFSKARKAYHRRKEERAARDFFTRTSTSGTKY